MGVRVCRFAATPLVLLLAALAAPAARAEGTRLLRYPDVSAEHLVFAYGGDLWIASRDGGSARRLTSDVGFEGRPKFSPDGRQVAFTAQYDGNTDIYVVPVGGGEPRRLTWHPDLDSARGWTPDGRRVVFASGRTSAPIPYRRFWSVSADGAGMPEPLPPPRAWRGQLSPDGTAIAYEMISSWETEWRGYRGGQNRPIWVLDLDDYTLTKSPWAGSNDTDPVYLGETVYFLSDRDWATNVYSWRPGETEVHQLTRFRDFDVKNLESGDGVLVFECGGYLYELDPEVGEPRQLVVEVRGDFRSARPHWVEAADDLRNATLSPTGKRALFEARGDIFTVPAEKGDVRNLTRSPGAADRAPAWSPDGRRIAWFSDEGGEYGLVVADQFGKSRRRIALDGATFYYTPVWSPDSERLSFTDADRVLWVVEIESGRATRVDGEGYAHPVRTIYPEWSPDSKWIAYTKRLDNQYNSIWVYSLADGATRPLTDGLSDSRAPAWDASGKYLYFLASTDFGLNVGWLDMTSFDRPVERAIYLAVLADDEPSPLAPESDDEAAGGEEGEGEDSDGDATEGEADEDEEVAVRIDFDGLDQRIVALDLPAGDYGGLAAGGEGVVFYLEASPGGDRGRTLHRYRLEDRETKRVAGGVRAFALSADGEKLLYETAGGWSLSGAGGEPDAAEDRLDLAEVRLEIDPPAEWRQIFREAWRYQRDFFYVDNVHGLDLDEVWAKYSPWVEHVRHRTDLSHLLDILGGETAVGHSFVFGGDAPDVDRVPVGLLGADLEVDGGRYRIAKIYTGENWNPELRAPLSGPGVDVRTGDYLLAVNGVELTADRNPFSLFGRTADRQTVLTVHDRPELAGAREVTVVPVANDSLLRQRDWIEGNRRRVDELSEGRLAYVWLPDTGQGGYDYFNRYYFAQQDKQGAVIDERFNGGGSAADYMIDLMARPLMGYMNNPIGERRPFTIPNAGIWGPKVMITNDAAGSGGDLLPYMFRLRGIGPLVGTRTWGGLVGIWDVPPLVDGGRITAPRGGFFNLDGDWEVENEGVEPDVEVEQLPAAVIVGGDPQLEKAVEVALELLDGGAIELKGQPADPVRVRRPERAGEGRR